MGRLLRRLGDLTYRSVALNQLDLKLSRHLDIEGGFFIEAGANDGIRQSNTYFFEKRRGWRGLLVEPVPELAAACRRNRPRCIVESVALVPFGFASPTIEMRFCNLMSLVKGAMRTEAEELAHIEKGCAVQKIETRELTVPTATLSSLLDKHGVERVDLLSLDVEGFELQVLGGIDFARHAPGHLLIEARYRNEIDAFLGDRYEPIADLTHHDVLYRAKRS
jgi:FkbM family methyltransferase